MTFPLIQGGARPSLVVFRVYFMPIEHLVDPAQRVLRGDVRVQCGDGEAAIPELLLHHLDLRRRFSVSFIIAALYPPGLSAHTPATPLSLDSMRTAGSLIDSRS